MRLLRLLRSLIRCLEFGQVTGNVRGCKGQAETVALNRAPPICWTRERHTRCHRWSESGKGKPMVWGRDRESKRSVASRARALSQSR